MTQLMVSQGRCQFCHRTADDVDRLITGDSSSICNACVGRCVALLEPQEAHADVEPPDRYVFQRLERHFAPLRPRETLATSRTYPIRQQADLQQALDELFGDRRVPDNFVGVQQQYRHELVSFSRMLEQNRNSVELAPAQYEEVDIGRGETVRCLKNGLWLLREERGPYAVALTHVDNYGQGGDSLIVEIATPPGDMGIELCTRVFEALERRLSKNSCYRGRALSLGQLDRFAGSTQRIRVHDLEPVTRDALILPDATLQAVERNVLLFAEQRQALRALGLSTQKGLLFHGAPGTGKTHCIRYLAGSLPGHTTLLITAEEMGLLPEYMALARLLQPALVVIEDADLIARERTERDSACDEVMLNRLLNELDGLRERADVFFVLTTNRPETLEPALASRPGRIDQAIEFPLPDERLRRRLIELYAKSLSIPARPDGRARASDGWSEPRVHQGAAASRGATPPGDGGRRRGAARDGGKRPPRDVVFGRRAQCTAARWSRRGGGHGVVTGERAGVRRRSGWDRVGSDDSP